MKKEILSRLVLEHVKVTWEGKVGKYTQFVSYKMTFWLALPSWLLKVPIDASCGKKLLWISEYF